MMFLSRYESVRKLREISTKKMEQLFMEALLILDRNRILLRTLDFKRSQSVGSLSGQEGSFAQTVSWRALCYDYVHVVSREIFQVEQEIIMIEKEVLLRRGAWQEARRELKKIEHLMEIEFQGQKQLEDRREERGQDDLQMSRWGRRSSITPRSVSSSEKGRDGL